MNENNINKIVQDLMENALEYAEKHSNLIELEKGLDNAIGMFYNAYGSEMTIQTLREYIRYIRYIRYLSK